MSDNTRRSTWAATANQDNATATATQAAPNGSAQSHYIRSIHVGYTNANAGKVATLKFGTTTIATFNVHNSRDIYFGDAGLKVTTGAAVSVELAASGTAGQNGHVAITGYTAE